MQEVDGRRGRRGTHRPHDLQRAADGMGRDQALRLPRPSQEVDGTGGRQTLRRLHPVQEADGGGERLGIRRLHPLQEADGTGVRQALLPPQGLQLSLIHI